MKRTKKALASLAIAGMALTMIPFNALAEGAFPTRLAGWTAVQTAVAIADQTGWTGTAILASSAEYGMVDSLTAGPLATFLKAPILLTGPGTLDADTKAELTKLNITKVYVMSGTAVISQAVLNEITDMGITVESLGGVDRFATSANIAQKMVDLGATVTKAAVAYGWSYQDALSIAPIAAGQTALSIASVASAQAMPILLTEKDSIPASVQAFLTTNTSVIATEVIGGTGVISDTVNAQLPSPTRHYGNTAYDTNLAVLKAFDSVLNYEHVFIANGETAIDALAGAPLAAKFNAGIVLTDGTVNEGIKYVSSKLSSTSVVTALGGTAVIPNVVLDSATTPTSPVIPPVTPPVTPPSGGGGGGGGSSVVTSAYVGTPAELAAALDKASITNIIFTANITSNLTANRSLTLDFGGYALTGNVSFIHNLTGTSKLAGTAANSIVGTLTVDTAKASFINDVKVSGGVNVVNVEPGTWTESADGNTLTITDDDGATITIVGDPGSIMVSEDASGALIISVQAGATVGSIVSNAPMTLQVAAGATVTNINVGAGAGGSTIINNGTTTNITVDAGANGTAITNNGTVTNVTTNAIINLDGSNQPGTTTGTDENIITPAELTVFINAVNTANASTVIDALQALAAISPLELNAIVTANAAAYVADFAANTTNTVALIQARVAAVNALHKAPDVLSASATIGGNTVNAVKQANGSWSVDLSTAESTAFFTGMNIVADSAATEAAMSVTITGGATINKTIQFTNGVANVDISGLLGELDTGAPGVSLASVRTLGLTTFTAVIKDGVNNSKNVTITLNL